MPTSQETIEQLANKDYKYGFVSDVEEERIEPGLNEDVIRLISLKKKEPEWLLDWRLKAYGLWKEMTEPVWHNVKVAPVDYQNITYYSAPKKQPKLNSLDEVDPEVKAKRLRVADPELYRFLFTSPDKTLSNPIESNVIARGRSAWTIARERYKSPSTTYHFPSGKVRQGDQISNWRSLPVGTIVEFGREDQQETAKAEFEGFLETTKASTKATDLVGDAFDEKTTIYFLPSGLIRTGNTLASSKRSRGILGKLPFGTRILLGYVYGGYITRAGFLGKSPATSGTIRLHFIAYQMDASSRAMR